PDTAGRRPSGPRSERKQSSHGRRLRAVRHLATAPVTVLNNPAICHEMVGSSVRDGGSDDVAGPYLRVTDCDVDQATISGSARHASGDSVLPSLADAYQDLDVRAHHRPVTGQRGFFDDGDQAVVAVLHHVLVDLTGQIGGRRAGAGRVLEREGTGEPGRPHHAQRVLEVRLRLAGKPHDDVGGNRGGRDGGPDPGNDVEITLLPV